MIALDNSFASYVERVLLARDITPEYAAKVRYCCRLFCEWLQCDPGISGLSCEPVNEFLAHLKEQGKRPDTVAGYRRAILVIWNEAYLCGYNSEPPLRVRKIKTPRDPVDALPQGDIRKLLDHFATLRDYFPNGVARSTFWAAMVHTAYSTGLRRGDLLRLRRDQIGEGGVTRVRQNKTGYPITVRLSAEAIEAINKMAVNELALPWPYHENALSRQFRKLVAAAGVHGQFRWLRRSAGSYAEAEQPGNGRRVLGHRSERVFRDFYDDQTITNPQPIAPPPLPT